ncbi:hypothetical protein [Nocardia sp. NPDC059228]|uniref:hypothetical protein n=1 Tax=Nocardia sp. NPDC059228 TaxID=3346777 RepID=UPI0036A1A47E
MLSSKRTPPFEVVAVLAVLGGVLLLAGVGRRPGCRWFGAFVAGVAAAFTVSMASSLMSTGEDCSYGLGFWLLVVAIIGSITALVNMIREKAIAPPDGAGGAADRTAGLFLILASAVTVGSGVLIISGITYERTYNGVRIIGHGWHIGDAIPVVIAVAASVVAVLLFAARGVRSRAMRITSGFAAGVVLGSALMRVFFNQIALGFPSGFGALTIGYGLGIVAVLLSVPAAIASLVAQLAKPRMPTPPIRYAPGFHAASGRDAGWRAESVHTGRVCAESFCGGLTGTQSVRVPIQCWSDREASAAAASDGEGV